MPKSFSPLTPLLLAACAALGACGQKGPLYLPQEAAVPAPPAAVTAPVPAHEQAQEEDSEEDSDK